MEDGGGGERGGSTGVFVGTKVFTVPWTNVIMGGGVRLTTKSLVEALRARVERNGGEPSICGAYTFRFPRGRRRR